MEKELSQRVIEVQNKTVRILEEIAQLIARLDKRRSAGGKQETPSTSETSFTTVSLPSQINISNVPLPTTIEEQPIGVNVQNTPISVSQSGSWAVGINGQPIDVNVQNSPLNVNVQNSPLNVNIQNTPIPVSQSGTWTVGISNQPIQTRYSDVLYASISATTSGDTQIVAGVSGKRIRVIAYAVVGSATVSIKFRSGTTDITGTMRIVEGGGIAHAYDQGLFQTNISQSLQINLSTAATVGGYVVYREI